MSRAGIAYVTALALGLVVLLGSGSFEIPLRYGLTSDLSYVWAGPRAALLGYDPYDGPSWRAAVDALGTQPGGPPVWSYPPATLVALLPLGLVPLPAVFVGWLVLSFLLAALALRALLREIAPHATLTAGAAGAALVLSQPAVVTLRTGQWSLVLLAALCAAVVLIHRSRPAVAGLAATALLVKAHLVALAIPSLALAMPRSARRRFVGVIALLVAALAVAAAVLRPEWWPAWWALVPASRAAEQKVTTAWRVLGDALGPAGIALAALLALATVLAVLAFRDDPLLASAIGIAGSLAFAPYMRSYDHLSLVVPIVLLVGIVARERPRAADRLGAAVLAAFVAGTWALIDVVGEARQSESLSWLVPASVLGLALLVAARRRAATPARPPGASPR